MFGKVIKHKDTISVSQVPVGVLFEVVSSVIPENNGLICVRTFNNIVCIVGNSSYKSFHSVWSNKVVPLWSVRVLDKEQVILSNKEI